MMLVAYIFRCIRGHPFNYWTNSSQLNNGNLEGIDAFNVIHLIRPSWVLTGHYLTLKLQKHLNGWSKYKLENSHFYFTIVN